MRSYLFFCTSVLMTLQAMAVDAPVTTSVESDVTQERWRGSLMYDEKELRWIHGAVKARDLHIPLDILLPGFVPDDTIKKSLSHAKGLEKTSPVPDKKEDAPLVSLPDDMLFIYINSIVYTDAVNWVIWLNDKKVGPGDADPLWEIVEVTAEHVIIRWKNFPLEKIDASWKHHFISLKDPLLLTNGENILVRPDTGTIMILLKPYQTFSGTVLEVMEGRVTSAALSAMLVAGSTSAPAPFGEVQSPIVGTEGNQTEYALYKAKRYHNQLDKLARFVQ